MKHGNTNFLQLSRVIFNEPPYCDLSQNAKWLYIVLNELEHRYTGKKENFFYRSNEDLANDTGLSESVLKRAKAELLKTDLVHFWRGHFIYNRGTPDEKKSEKRISCYRINK